MPKNKDEKCDIFPWEYICICMNKEINTIRELNDSHIIMIRELENNIKNKLSNRFNLKKNNIIISVRHNISTNIGLLCFNINYIDNYNNYSKLKWEDESDILLDNLINLLNDNKINEHITDINKAIKSLFSNLEKIISYASKTLKYLLISLNTIPVP